MTQIKGKLHPRNPHRNRYDFDQLCQTLPELSAYVTLSPRGDKTIDFADNRAVMSLNKALLAHFYQVRHWQIPPDYLCPPIPGRADYIHYLADLIAQDGIPAKGKHIRALDIGTGANCIYPILGSQSYDWRFVASDIDPVSVNVAQLIVESNPCLKGAIKVTLQKDKSKMFSGIINAQDQFDMTLCNPPFYASLQQAKDSNARKQANLAKGKSKGEKEPSKGRNFGGQQAELWCEGGELAFLTQMAQESVDYGHQVRWFTSLVSNKQHIKPLKQQLQQLGVKQIKVIDMAQGQKISRFIAWQF